MFSCCLMLSHVPFLFYRAWKQSSTNFGNLCLNQGEKVAMDASLILSIWCFTRGVSNSMFCAFSNVLCSFFYKSLEAKSSLIFGVLARDRKTDQTEKWGNKKRIHTHKVLLGFNPPFSSILSSVMRRISVGWEGGQWVENLIINSRRGAQF